MVDKSVINTIIAEAGGSNPDAMRAVAAVIKNRATQSGLTPDQVVKQKGQFEGYSNPGPASLAAQQMPGVRALAEQSYNDIDSGAFPDPTQGGTMFHAASISPGWKAPNGTVNIGGNVFYKGNAPLKDDVTVATVLPNGQPAGPPLVNHKVDTVPIDSQTGNPIVSNDVGGGPNWSDFMTTYANEPQNPAVNAIDAAVKNPLPAPAPLEPSGTSWFDSMFPTQQSTPPAAPQGGGFDPIGLLSSGVHTAANYVENKAGDLATAAAAKAPEVANALAPALLKTVAGRSMVVDPMIARIGRHPIDIPNAGQVTQTQNHGQQVIGQRLNGSPRGMTVTGQGWFDGVRGL